MANEGIEILNDLSSQPLEGELHGPDGEILDEFNTDSAGEHIDDEVFVGQNEVVVLQR